MEEFKELFLEHYEILSKYKSANNKYNKLLEKKAMLIIQVQPKATDFTKELIKGGTIVNKYDEFVEKLEKLDPELQQARNERDLLDYFLKKKELELKDSNNILDKVYYLRYVKKMKVIHIAFKINYSKEQTYRKIREIEEKLKMTQNDTTKDLK